jgi:hypothetical protein
MCCIRRPSEKTDLVGRFVRCKRTWHMPHRCTRRIHPSSNCTCCIHRQREMFLPVGRFVRCIRSRRRMLFPYTKRIHPLGTRTCCIHPRMGTNHLVDRFVRCKGRSIRNRSRCNQLGRRACNCMNCSHLVKARIDRRRIRRRRRCRRDHPSATCDGRAASEGKRCRYGKKGENEAKLFHGRTPLESVDCRAAVERKGANHFSKGAFSKGANHFSKGANHFSKGGDVTVRIPSPTRQAFSRDVVPGFPRRTMVHPLPNAL